jgi:hypothetical protein
MRLLAPFENVTVLYGHIHREDRHETGKVHHLAARSLIFGLPDPATAGEKVPQKFDPARPFNGLGLRLVRRGAVPGGAVGAEELELTMRERSGTEGFAQLLRPTTL